MGVGAIFLIVIVIIIAVIVGAFLYFGGASLWARRLSDRTSGDRDMGIPLDRESGPRAPNHAQRAREHVETPESARATPSGSGGSAEPRQGARDSEDASEREPVNTAS
jgi:hypothetical protein